MKKRNQDIKFIKAALIIGFLLFLWRLINSIINSIINSNLDMSFLTFAIPLIIWGFSPYILLYLLRNIFMKNKLSLILSLIALIGMDLIIHAEVFLWPSSSTSALIFLVSPIYLVIAMLIGKFTGDLISWIIKKSK